MCALSRGGGGHMPATLKRAKGSGWTRRGWSVNAYGAPSEGTVRDYTKILESMIPLQVCIHSSAQ